MLGKLTIYTAKVVSLLIIFHVYSCKPDDVSFSNVPEISLNEVALLQDTLGNDSLIVLVIGFQDGDGDIGLTGSDTAPPFNFGSPYFHNLPVTYLVTDASGAFVELKDQSGAPYGNQHERIPILTPSGKYKAIQGNISIKLSANPLLSKPDSLKLKISLIDRALNVSNTIHTETILLKH